MDVEGELLCLAHEHWVREILESEIRDNRTAVVVHTAVLERAPSSKANDAAADSATTSRLGSLTVCSVHRQRVRPASGSGRR